MLSTAEDIISSSTIAAGDGREVAAVAAAAAAAATNIPLHSLLTLCNLSLVSLQYYFVASRSSESTVLTQNARTGERE